MVATWSLATVRVSRTGFWNGKHRFAIRRAAFTQCADDEFGSCLLHGGTHRRWSCSVTSRTRPCTKAFHSQVETDNVRDWSVSTESSSPPLSGRIDPNTDDLHSELPHVPFLMSRQTSHRLEICLVLSHDFRTEVRSQGEVLRIWPHHGPQEGLEAHHPVSGS